jgi:ATP-dependent exoDNAse (exonuclease V) beta subunit
MGKFEVYNASAGAGKTYALVKNYLAICLASDNTMKFREILAITFTNKAANEMKERITAQLEVMASYNSPQRQEDKKYAMLFQLAEQLDMSVEKLSFRSKDVLTAILHNYSAFSVSTIDKFTNRLIRSFAQDLKLNSNYEVELDNGEMLAEAIDRMLADLDENSATSGVLLEFISNRLDEGKSPRPEQGLQDMGKNLFDEGALPFLKKLAGFDSSRVMEAGKGLRKEQEVFKKYLNDTAKELLALIHSQGLGKGDFTRGTVYKYLLYLTGDDEKKWIPNKTVAEAIEGKSFYPSGKSKALAAQFEPIESELRGGLLQLVEKLKDGYPRYHLVNRVLRDIYSLATLAEIEKNLELVKDESNRLPIGEFNKLISEKLEQEPTAYLYEKLGDRYHYFFVDEFQDTSVLQWKNLLPLINNAMASSGSVMIVGDGKQSIYRWRGGDVSQFISLSDNTDTSNKIEVNGEIRELYDREKISLGSNFRSRKTVVDFNNRFFTTAGGLLEGERFKNLYNEAYQNPERQDGGYVYLNRLEYDKDSFEERQCDEVYRIVQDALSRGFTLKDITIITRRKHEGAVLAEFLLGKGLRVVSPDSLMLEQSAEVRSIVSFIKFLVRPDDHGVRWDFLDKLWVNQATDTVEKHQFINSLIHQPAYLVHQFIEQNSEGYQLEKLLQLSLVDKAYYIAMLLRLPVQTNPFLHTFMDQVIDYQYKNENGESGFVRWWDDKGSSRSISLPEGNDALNIMTVHKSKGLEFPITIVPFADWFATYEPGGSDSWIDLESVGIGDLPVARVKLSESEMVFEEYENLTKQNKENVYLDNINLAYVAFTRAVDELYVIGSKRKGRDSSRLSRYINQYYTLNEAEGDVVEMGNPVQRIKEQPQKVTMGLPSYEAANWLERVKISVDAPLDWTTGEAEATSYGKKVHSLLAQVRAKAELEQILDLSFAYGTIDDKERSELRPLVEALLENEILAPYFAENLKVLNEEEILIPGGRTARPDRVVLEGEVAHIIDYKTGEISETHKLQLDNYRVLLNQMGYEAGDNVLIYLSAKPEVMKW